MNPVRLHWDLHTPTDQETTWRVLSNTDRFNRACGLGFQFEERAFPDGSVRRTGTALKFGMKLEWQELAFEIQVPDRFVSTRVFPSGPLARLTTTCALEESPDGTRVSYTVELLPRIGLLKPLVAFDAVTTTRPMLDRTLKRVLVSLEGHAPLDLPPLLAPGAGTRLAAWVASVRPKKVGAAVERLIRAAPLDVQDRIRPLQVASSAGVDEDETILALLDGVRAGVLALRWELLCPSCHAPKAHAPRLGEGPTDVHCTSCNIRYDATFPEAVAVSFRPTPVIREFAVAVDCLLSPSRTPHVLGQLRIPPADEVALEITLKPGGYRIETHPGRGSAVLEVRDGLPDHDLALDLTDDGVRPRVLRLAPGRRRISLRSRLGVEALVTVERRWMPPHTLTAGRLLELDGARDLLPADAVSPELEVTVRRLVVVAAAVPRLEPAVAARAEAFTLGNGKAVFAFADLPTALSAAQTLAGPPGVGVALAWGPVVLMRRAEHTTPAGSTVERALQALHAVGGGRIAVHVAHKHDPAFVVAARAVEGLAIDDPGPSSHLLLRWRPVRRIEPDVPATVADQVVVEQLARGAHGRVFRARAPDGTPTVVKLLVPELTDDPEAAQRFYAEALVTARLDHPHVVRLLDWGESDDGQLYMVLEHLDGEVLATRLERGPLPVPEVVALGIQVCSALEATHAARVLHRDLKPANLFLVAGDQLYVKVLDFGIAHRLDDVEEESPERVPGTPRYMSPEQVDQDPLDARSDLYTLGIVLYECLAGVLPFDGSGDVVVAMQRLVKAPRPLLDAAPNVPPALARVVMQALELDPPRRYSDARAMREALEAFAGIGR